MKKTIILIAAMAMTTILAQANEAPAAVEEVIIEAIEAAAPDSSDANESNATKEEDLKK